MVDVRHHLYNDRVTFRGGPTLLYATGPTERDWIDRPAYPSMTKEYSTATAPRFRNNSGPDRSHFRGFVDQTVSLSNAPRSIPDAAHGPLANYPSMPQRPVASQGGLPQRPGPHIQPAHAAKMPQREVCRNFQAGFCGWGDKCHRSHVLDGGLYAPNFVAPTRRGPPDVRPGQLAPPLHPASTVGSVASVNYININRPQQASSTGPDGLTQPAAAATSDARSSKPPGVNHLHPPPPPAVLPGIAPRTNVASQAVRPEPTILDVNRLMRAAELDPRPSRRTNVVCRDYQKGLCRHGDRCPGTHIFLVPQECITQLLPPPEKPAVRKIPATVTYTAADGSMHEREVCKTWAAGLCPKGDTCRFAHVTEDELEEEEFTGESDSSETCPTTGDIETEVEPTAFERHGNASREGTAGRPGQGVARRKPRPVCRLYFKKRYCYKVPCKYSHDILDLARQLPSDDELALQHAEEIRMALAKFADESARLTLISSSSLASTPIVDTAKKCQKKPRKPGAEAEGSSTDLLSIPAESGPSDGSVRQTAGRAKGKGRAQGNAVEQTVAREKREPYDDADGNSTDTTFYSAESQAGPPKTPSNAMEVAAQTSTARLPCFDYIHGRCNWPNCRYSHDIDREKMRRDFRERGASKAGSSKPVVCEATPPAASSTPCPRVHVAPRNASSGSAAPLRRHQPQISGNQAPVVPPGLGLEKLAANAPRASQPRVPPESITITVLDSTKVTFGSGFAISHITTGFECRKIILEDVPASVVPAAISAELGVFGEVTAVVAIDSAPDDTVTYRVSFGTGNAAAQAVDTLDGKELLGSKVSARLDQKKSTGLGGGTLYDGDVLFELPTPSQIGFVGYPTEDLAQQAIQLARTIDLGFSRVIAEPYQGIPNVGTHNVRFRGLPPNFTPEDLKKHFVDRLGVDEKEPRGGKKRSGRRGKGKEKERGQAEDETEKQGAKQPAEKCEGVMLQRAKYSSLHGAIQGLQRMLEEYDEDVSLNVLPPPYGKVVRIWAHFNSPDAAASACEALHRFCPRFVAKQRIFAHHIKSLRYALPSGIFDVLAYDIDLLRSYIHDEDGTSISVIDKRALLGPTVPVTVKLVSHSMASLTKAKTAFERLLRGEKVTDDGQIVWNDFFGGKAGEQFLRDLEAMHPKVKINSDSRRRTLALFGIREERERVRAAIVDRVRLLKSQLIHRYPVAGHLIGVFMSDDLVKLQQELGHENVWFDLTHQRLVVRGGEDVQKVAQLAVLHAQQRLPRRSSASDVVCPVCLGDVSHPVTLACGHTWCKACMVGYLNASVDNKTFPLTCLADEARCSQPIALSTAQRLLSTGEFDAIVNAAFTAYVQQRPNEYHYCPTPDCAQVYRKMARVPKGAPALQCPSCLVRICPHCDMEYHETVSCQDRNPEDEMLFEHWKMGHDVKDCPSCRVPIERTAGCNHMTCASCKIHICWACLATFSKSGEVYEHMRSIHGGIGL